MKSRTALLSWTRLLLAVLWVVACLACGRRKSPEARADPPSSSGETLRPAVASPVEIPAQLQDLWAGGTIIRISRGTEREGESGSAPGQLLRPDEPSAQKSLKDLAAKVRAASSPAQAMDALASASELDSEGLLLVVDAALECSDDSVRAAGLELLEGYRGTEVARRLTNRLKDPAEEVRLVAVAASSGLDTDAFLAFARTAMANQSEEVRQTILDMVAESGVDIQLQLRLGAIASPWQDVVMRALHEMQGNMIKPEMEPVIGLIESPVPAVREGARSLLQLWVGKEFTKAREALSWWRANESRYSADMAEEVAE